MTLYSLVGGVGEWFGGTCCLHLQGKSRLLLSINLGSLLDEGIPLSLFSRVPELLPKFPLSQVNKSRETKQKDTVSWIVRVIFRASYRPKFL
jgi:hypothetical protein